MSEDEKLDILQRDLDRLREEMKEREPSVLNAFRTFASDVVRWQRGERDFPQSAALGVMFAYLRPRLILTAAGIGALVMAGMQVTLLVQQNTLIENQNALLESQTRSTQLAVVTEVLSKLNSDDEKQTDLLIAGLESYGDQALEPLIVVSKSNDDDLAQRALEAIVRSAGVHRDTEFFKTMNLFFYLLQGAVRGGNTDKKLLARGLHGFCSYSATLPEQIIKSLPPSAAEGVMYVHTFAVKVSELLAPYEGKYIQFAEGPEDDSALWFAAARYPDARSKWCKNLQLTKASNLGNKTLDDWRTFCQHARDPIEKSLGVQREFGNNAVTVTNEE